MKTTGFIFLSMFALAACTNNEQVQKLKDLADKDSILLIQTHQKDSAISSFLGEMNTIQDTLDNIKTKEKIISVTSSEQKGSKQSILDDIKKLDDLIILNDKKINRLAWRLRKMGIKNDTLQSLVKHLYSEIADKEEEIASLQAQLGKANDSIKAVNTRFGDSMMVIRNQRAQVLTLKTEITTVYYTTGTMKNLQDKGVIDKVGGFIGIGRIAQMNPRASSSLFTQSDLVTLHGISLNGKFRRLVTAHPDGSYSIKAGDKSDSLLITDANSFWSRSKYLVVITR